MDIGTENNSKKNFNTLIDLITKDKTTIGNDWKKLLAQSLFYYCCGDDISPICYEGLQFPVYVYVDLCIFDSFIHLYQNMEQDLQNHGFSLLQRKDISINDFFREKQRSSMKKMILTEWVKNDISFCLLFVYGDADESYQFIYEGNQKYNYIIPRCVCDIASELFPPRENPRCYDFGKLNLQQLEKRAEYIIGDGYTYGPNNIYGSNSIYGPNYELIDTVPHLHGYISVFRRFYYYLY